MKKIIYTIGLSVALIASTAATAEDVVKLGSDFTYPPFNYKDANQVPVGFDIEIADALCAEAKLDCEWVTIGWDGLIPGLMARKIDVIMASMRITEERKKRVLFTDRYYKTPAQFIAAADADFEISAAGLKGKAVGVQRGTIHDTYITEKFGDAVKLVKYDGQEEVFLDMENGRLDLVFGNADQLALNFLDKERGQGFGFIGEPVTDEAYIGQGTALAMRQRDTELAEKFNAAIAAIRANGTYDRIAAKYFTFDIYGD